MISLIVAGAMLAINGIGLAEDKAKDEAKVRGLITQLSDDEWETREKAQEELVKMGASVYITLAEELKKATDPEVKMRLDNIIKQLVTLPECISMTFAKMKESGKYRFAIKYSLHDPDSGGKKLVPRLNGFWMFPGVVYMEMGKNCCEDFFCDSVIPALTLEEPQYLIKDKIYNIKTGRVFTATADSVKCRQLLASGFYEWIISELMKEYKMETPIEESVGDKKCRLISLVYESNEEQLFNYKIWVDKNSLLPVKICLIEKLFPDEEPWIAAQWTFDYSQAEETGIPKEIKEAFKDDKEITEIIDESEKKEEEKESSSGRIDSLKQIYLGTQSDIWVIKALAALALKEIPEPESAEVVAKILPNHDSNRNLVYYALSALSKFPSEVLKESLSKDVITSLNDFWYKQEDGFYRKSIEAIFNKISSINDYRDWCKWWEKQKDNYKDGSKSDKSPGKATSVTVNIPVNTNEKIRQKEPEGSSLDCVFVVDTTLSMKDLIPKDAMKTICYALRNISPSLRLGLVQYWDDAQVTVPLAADSVKIIRAIDGLQAGGGGNSEEENLYKGLELALLNAKMVWRESADKIIIIIGDAFPYQNDIDKTCWLASNARDLTMEKSPNYQADSKDDRKDSKPYSISTCFVGQDENVEKVFSRIAGSGGGTMVKGDLADKLLFYMLIHLYGKQWELQIKEFIWPFMSIVSRQMDKK